MVRHNLVPDAIYTIKGKHLIELFEALDLDLEGVEAAFDSGTFKVSWFTTKDEE